MTTMPFQRAAAFLLGLSMAGGVAASSVEAAPSVVLIAPGSDSGRTKAGCVAAVSGLGKELASRGVTVRTVSIDDRTGPTTALIMAMQENGPTEPVFVACTGAVLRNGRLFLVGGEADGGARMGLSVESLTRLAGAGGATVLDLHDVKGENAERAVLAWAAQDGPASRRRAVTDTAVQGGLIALMTRDARKGPVIADRDAILALGAEPAPSDVSPRSPEGAQAVSGTAVPEAAMPSSLDGSGASMPSQPSGGSSAPSGAAIPAAVPDVKPGVKSDAPPATSAVTTPVIPPGAPPHMEADSDPQSKRKPAKPVVRPWPARVRKADPAIRRVQVGLLSRGFYHGSTDGLGSFALTAAIRHYQSVLGDTQTGTLTKDELQQLMGVSPQDGKMP